MINLLSQLISTDEMRPESYRPIFRNEVYHLLAKKSETGNDFMYFKYRGPRSCLIGLLGLYMELSQPNMRSI